jgi:hypothetical protein
MSIGIVPAAAPSPARLCSVAAVSKPAGGILLARAERKKPAGKWSSPVQVRKVTGEVMSEGTTREGGFFPLPLPPAAIRDLRVRRPSYAFLSAFPRARTPPLCLRPRRVLSLESNGEVTFARTVGHGLFVGGGWRAA